MEKPEGPRESDVLLETGVAVETGVLVATGAFFETAPPFEVSPLFEACFEEVLPLLLTAGLGVGVGVAELAGRPSGFVVFSLRSRLNPEQGADKIAPAVNSEHALRLREFMDTT